MRGTEKRKKMNDIMKKNAHNYDGEMRNILD